MEKIIEELKERALAEAVSWKAMPGRFKFLQGMKFDYAYERNDAYYFFLALLCERLRPKVALDLGTCEGVSSYCMAVFNPEGLVITIDRDQSLRRPECKIANVVAVEQDTEKDLVPELDEIAREIGVAFVDTYHEEHLAQAEFDRWRPRMLPGSVILFDGCTWPPRPSMAEWWGSFKPKGCVKVDLHELHSREEAGFGAVIVGQ